MIAGVTVRILVTDEALSLQGSTLKEAIQEDLHLGLVPFFVIIHYHCGMWFVIPLAQMITLIVIEIDAWLTYL